MHDTTIDENAPTPPLGKRRRMWFVATLLFSGVLLHMLSSHHEKSQRQNSRRATASHGDQQRGRIGKSRTVSVTADDPGAAVSSRSVSPIVSLCAIRLNTRVAFVEAASPIAIVGSETLPSGLVTSDDAITLPVFRFALACTPEGARSKYRSPLQFAALPARLFNRTFPRARCNGSDAGSLLVVAAREHQVNHAYYVMHQVVSAFTSILAIERARMPLIGIAVVVIPATPTTNFISVPPNAVESQLVKWLRLVAGPSRSVVVAANPTVFGGSPSIGNASGAYGNPRVTCAEQAVIGWSRPVFIRGAAQHFELDNATLSEMQRRVRDSVGFPAPLPVLVRKVNVLVVQRSEKFRRRFIDLPVLVAALRNVSGVDAVSEIELEGAAPSVQAKAFANATVLIAVHGAALSNMWLMPARSLIVEVGVAVGNPYVSRMYFSNGTNVTRTMYGRMALMGYHAHEAIAVPSVDLDEAKRHAPATSRGSSRLWKWANYPVGDAAFVDDLLARLRRWMVSSKLSATNRSA